MIRYYEGVEGAGKTCLMTKDLCLHYSSGGRILAFPGYEVYGNTKKQVISELMMPEQVFELISSPDTEKIRKQRFAIAIDEVFNFFNHHNWQSKINDILSAVFQQRRKLGAVVLMTGPEFDFLPRDVRFMVHEVVHCTNAHTFNRSVPDDFMCKYYKEDKRGMLCNPLYRFSCKRKFYMRPWQKHFDTYAAVGYNSNIKVRIANREVIYGPDGKLIEASNSEFTEQDNSYVGMRVDIAAKVAELQSKGIKRLEHYEFQAVLEEMGLSPNRNIKAAFAARGLYYDRAACCYFIRGKDSVRVAISA